MKTIKYLSLLFSLLVLNLVSVKAQDEKKVDNPNAPEITFENDVHDYGTIKAGADGSCEFTFKNTGKEPLIISAAK